MEANFKDELKWNKDNDILKIIGDEIIYYSNKIRKYNSFLIKKERFLILTDKSIYNIQNKKAKRNMKYDEILGITFSSQSNDFVIHANQGYDFHYNSPDKILIIYIISRCYENILKKPIILCEVKDKSLRSYVTTKKDKKKDSNSSRLKEENRIDTLTFMIDNDPAEVNKRSNIETSRGSKLISVSTIEENSKDINTDVIFSNDDEIKNVDFCDFQLIRIIGKGITGRVLLSKNSKNNEYYAMKSIQKDILEIDNSSQPSYKEIIKEKLENLKFPFLIHVQMCFETDDRIYFTFPYIQGEELCYNIKTCQNLNEEKIRFYSSIIGLTLEFLHKNGIEYKNFNSKNILIDKEGYLKLVPFHIGKILKIKYNKKTQKIFNKYKNEYSPPEIFSEGDSYNLKSADWWNLGVLIYEMKYNIPPFFSDVEDEMKDMISNTELKFPKNPPISDNLRDLISKLLNKNYEERLGYQNDFEDIKKHEFFKDVNFDNLLQKKIEAPYKPIIGDILEKNKNIEERFTYEDLEKSGILISN